MSSDIAQGTFQVSRVGGAKTMKEIVPYKPQGEWKNGETAYESVVFQIELDCPEESCDGSLHWTGESRPPYAGGQLHYHRCNKCKGIWMIGSRTYPYPQYVRKDQVEDFLSGRRVAGATSSKSPRPVKAA